MRKRPTPTSIFRRVSTPRVTLSRKARGGSLFLAAALISATVFAIVGIWSIWVGILRNQPPEPVEVWYDPYELGELPQD